MIELPDTVYLVPSAQSEDVWLATLFEDFGGGGVRYVRADSLPQPSTEVEFKDPQNKAYRHLAITLKLT